MNLTEFIRWASEHRDRHPFARLPSADGDAGLRYYQAWSKALHSLGEVDAETLTLASERLVSEPPKRAADHFETLKRYTAEAMRARGDATSAANDTRETAEAASRDCRFCGGSGLAPVWHPGPDPARKIPETVAAHCVCRMGRWVRRTQSCTAPDVYKRTPDLVDAQAGRSVWLAEDPGLDGHERRTFPAGYDRMAILRSLVRCHGLERQLERSEPRPAPRTAPTTHRPPPRVAADDPILAAEYPESQA